MAITSTHAVGHPQADGRRYVQEQHTDSVGKVHLVEYLAEDGADYVAIRTAHATVLAELLAEAEADAQLGQS